MKMKYWKVSIRAVQKEETNEFTTEKVNVKEDPTETLVLALDAFVQQFDGKLSFTTDDLSFEESTHSTACGVTDLDSAHLLANEHIPSVRFVLNLNLDYDELA